MNANIVVTDQVEPMDYLDPVATVKRDDYEVVPTLDSYKQPQSHYEVSPYLSHDFNVGKGTLLAGETLPEDEEVYVDPGHEKEEIYEWLEQRQIHRINRIFIRYVAVILLNATSTLWGSAQLLTCAHL